MVVYEDFFWFSQNLLSKGRLKKFLIDNNYKLFTQESELVNLPSVCITMSRGGRKVIEQGNKCTGTVDLMSRMSMKYNNEIQSLKQKMQKMEIEKTRNNLILFGIPENENEDLKEVVKNFFTLKLEIQAGIEITVAIE